MLKSLVKNILCRSNSRLLRYWLPFYNYNLSPACLSYLCAGIEATRELPGPILEIGCASGATTVFLNEHMTSLGIEKPYFCIDTFAGFTNADIDYEARVRGKNNAAFLRESFSVNDQLWFQKTMQINGIRRVRCIQADVNEFDFAGIDQISLCLIDVDLYQPVKAALYKTFPLLAPGGMMIVDDCTPLQECNSRDHFDGAYQAYLEFTSERELPNDIVYSRLGLIRPID